MNYEKRLERKVRVGLENNYEAEVKEPLFLAVDEKAINGTSIIGN